MLKTLAANQKNKNKQIKIIIMGKGKENMSGKSQIFSGGGSKIGLNQKLSSAFYGERDMSYPGGMPGGANKSYHGPKKDGESKGDQSNTKKDYSMDKGNTDPNYKSKKDGESKGDQSASDKDYSTPKYPKGPNKEKLKMVKKDGKNVPFYAADGEGKM